MAAQEKHQQRDPRRLSLILKHMAVGTTHTISRVFGHNRYTKNAMEKWKLDIKGLQRTTYRVREQFGHEFHIRQGQGFLTDGSIVAFIVIKKLQHSTLDGKEWPVVEIDSGVPEEEVDDSIDEPIAQPNPINNSDEDDGVTPSIRRSRRRRTAAAQQEDDDFDDL